MRNRVFEAEPYAARGERDTLDATDGIYDETVELTLSEEDGG